MAWPVLARPHWRSTSGIASRRSFPDGQLYVNLRGFDPDQPPLAPRDVLPRFLRTLGADPSQMPMDVDELAGAYRSLLSGRRVLVVLDNAASAGQVRPLLPGTAGCLALVTSRNTLSGLVARDGAHRVTPGRAPASRSHRPASPDHRQRPRRSRTSRRGDAGPAVQLAAAGAADHRRPRSRSPPSQAD